MSIICISRLNFIRTDVRLAVTKRTYLPQIQELLHLFQLHPFFMLHIRPPVSENFNQL